LYRSAQKRDYANGSPLSQKRDSEHRPEPRKLDRSAPGIFWISEYIRNMDHLAFESGSPCKRSSPNRYRILSLVFQEFLRGAMISGKMKEIADSLINKCKICIAEPRRRLNKRVKHSLQIKSRAADHLKDVGGCGLLLQGFAQLVQQPRVFD